MSLLAVRVVAAMLLSLLVGGPAAVSACAWSCDRGLDPDVPSGQHHAPSNATADTRRHGDTGAPPVHQGHHASPPAAEAAPAHVEHDGAAVSAATSTMCVVRPIEEAVTSHRAAVPPPPVALLPAALVADHVSPRIERRAVVSFAAGRISGPPPPLVLRI